MANIDKNFDEVGESPVENRCFSNAKYDNAARSPLGL